MVRRFFYTSTYSIPVTYYLGPANPPNSFPFVRKHSYNYFFSAFATGYISNFLQHRQKKEKDTGKRYISVGKALLYYTAVSKI